MPPYDRNMNHNRRHAVTVAPSVAEPPRVCSRPVPLAPSEASITASLADMIARGYEPLRAVSYCRACFCAHSILRLVARVDLDMPGAPSQVAYEAGPARDAMDVPLVLTPVADHVRDRLVREYQDGHRRGAASMVAAAPL